MSSIQDRIRRLQSADDDATRPASGVVEAAKERLTRGGSTSGPGSVSNIASRFTAAVEPEEKPRGPSVAALRDRVATTGTSSTVQARAAALAGSKDELSSARVATLRGALEAAPTSGNAVSSRTGRLERANAEAATKAPDAFSAKASIFERAAEPLPSDTPAAIPVTAPVPKSNFHRAKSDKESVRPGFLSARASLFEKSAKPTPTDPPVPAPVTATAPVLESKALDGSKSDSAPVQPSTLSARASLFEQPAAPGSTPPSVAETGPKSKILEKERNPSQQSTRPSSLSARASVFEQAASAKKEENSSSHGSRVAGARTPLGATALAVENLASGRVAAAKASLAPTLPPSTGAVSGKVASAAKEREVEGLRAELAEMVMVSKELLKELATLRAGMRDMESTRDALQKRIQQLERKAK